MVYIRVGLNGNSAVVTVCGIDDTLYQKWFDEETLLKSFNKAIELAHAVPEPVTKVWLEEHGILQT